MKKEKTIGKLYPTRHLTVSRKPGSTDTTALLLAGKWLEEAGFEMGAIVRLEVWKDRIVICKTDQVWVEEERVVTRRKRVNAASRKQKA